MGRCGNCGKELEHGRIERDASLDNMVARGEPKRLRHTQSLHNLGIEPLKMIRVSLLVALALSCGIYASTAIAQSLSDTADFIKQNVDGAEVVSCDQIRVHIKKKGPNPNSLSPYSASFAIRDVRVWTNPSYGNNWVFIDCLSGKCAKSNNGPTEGTIVLQAVVEYDRVLKALLHLQELCGGPIKPVF